MCALLGVTLSLPAVAQWKWRDKNGQMQYSDLPPPIGIPDRDILQRPHPLLKPTAAAPAASAASGVASAPSRVEPELEAKRRKAEEDKVAKEQAERVRREAEQEKMAAARASNCTRAQSYLKTLNDGMRIARTNAKGEREFLDDQQRAAEVERAKGIIATDCK